MARAGRQPDSDVTVALMCVPLPLAGLFRVTLQEVEVQASEEQRTCGEQPGASVRRRPRTLSQRRLVQRSPD